MLDPGDVVLVERPTYLTALQVFRMYQARAVAVPGDDEGIDPDTLEKAIAEHRPKMLYAVPTFRNPSGETWSPERRRRIAQLTAAAGVVVVEDDPYGLLRYDGQPLPAVKAFDEAGNIIYLGSFSKIISPGLRVGYAVAREQLLRKLVIGKQTTDVHSSNLSQYIVNAFGRSPAFQSHLETICRAVPRQAGPHAGRDGGALPGGGPLDPASGRPLHVGDAAGNRLHHPAPGAGGAAEGGLHPGHAVLHRRRRGPQHAAELLQRQLRAD